MKLKMANEADFRRALENYRYGVKEVLPGYLGGRFTDHEALVDEVALILDSRDTLAQVLAGGYAQMQSYLTIVDELDQALLRLKDALLARLDFYVGFRQQVTPPRNHWWYFLDEIVASPSSETDKPPLHSYWLSLTPAPELAIPARPQREKSTS